MGFFWWWCFGFGWVFLGWVSVWWFVVVVFFNDSVGHQQMLKQWRCSSGSLCMLPMSVAVPGQDRGKVIQ